MLAGSHVHDVLDCLQFVRTWREQNPSHHSEVSELFNELEVRLCELMSKMLTGPLTGKMFAMFPHEQLTAEQMQASLREQTTV